MRTAPPLFFVPPARQRGASLFTVMIILLLALLLVLPGLSVINLNEMLVGNQSDNLRTYAAAQALLDAAQRDIRLNGLNCNAPYLGTSGTNDTFVTPSGNAMTCLLRFPRTLGDYTGMFTGGNTNGNTRQGQCASDAVFQGICFSSGPTDPTVAITALTATSLSIQQWSNGVDYNNSFTAPLDGGAGIDYGMGATAGGTATADPSLALSGMPGTSVTTSRGKYWIEIYPYNVNASALTPATDVMSAPTPDNAYPFVFRITAMAKGLKSGTVSILRTYYVPFPQQPATASGT